MISVGCVEPSVLSLLLAKTTTLLQNPHCYGVSPYLIAQASDATYVGGQPTEDVDIIQL